MSLTVAASRGGCAGAACGPDDGFGRKLVIVHLHGQVCSSRGSPSVRGDVADVEVQLTRDEAILFAHAILRRCGVHTESIDLALYGDNGEAIR